LIADFSFLLPVGNVLPPLPPSRSRSKRLDPIRSDNKLPSAGSILRIFVDSTQHSPPLPLEVGPLNPARRESEAEPQSKLNFGAF